MQYEGIDVSVYQGTIDWASVARAGIRFAMVRAGSGQTADSRAAENARGANANGIVLGLYWFSYAYTVAMARAEANRLIQFARDYDVRFPLVWDYEEASVQHAAQKGVTVTRELVTAMAEIFCKTVYAAGYTPMVYSNRNFLMTYVDLAAITAPVRLWLAQWGAVLPAREPMIWQYSSTGRVDGIEGNVDLDRAWELPVMPARRLQTLAEVSSALREETAQLVESGALRGTGRGLDVTEDMLRSMIVAKRYTDSRTGG